MGTHAEAAALLENILLIRDGGPWEQDALPIVQSFGYSVLGPFDELRVPPDAISGLEANPQLAIIQAEKPGPCGFAAPNGLWTEHQIPSIIISKSEITQDLTPAANAGVFAILNYPTKPEDIRSAIMLAWAFARRTLEDNRTIQRLEESLASRRAVELAKWKLIEQKGLTEPEAHAFLQKEARSRRLKISQVAEGFLESCPETPAP